MKWVKITGPEDFVKVTRGDVGEKSVTTVMGTFRLDTKEWIIDKRFTIEILESEKAARELEKVLFKKDQFK